MCKCPVSTFFLYILPSEARLGCTQEEIGREEVGVQSPLTVFFFIHTLFCCHWITAVDDVVLCMELFFVWRVWHSNLHHLPLFAVFFFFFYLCTRCLNRALKWSFFRGFQGRYYYESEENLMNMSTVKTVWLNLVVAMQISSFKNSEHN